MIRPWFRHAAVPWKTTATQTRASGENRVSTKPGVLQGVGMVTGPDGSGVMWVHGLATFAWDAGDEAGRRLAAVQLWKLKAATQAQVAEAFEVIPVSVWRWEKALAAGGVAGLVPDRGARGGPRS